MNDWMGPSWDDAYVPDRGKVLTKEEIRRCPSSTATRTRTTTHPVPTLPGVSAKGRLLHARLMQPVRRLPPRSDGVPGGA